jgi:cytohesin
LHFVSFGGVHNGGLVDVASTLIKYGADVEVKDKDQRTPLHLAVISNNTRMVEFLLSHGGNAETYDKDQRTPLLDAVSKGRHNSIVKELLKHGADVNARDEKQKTPLHLAALSGDLNTIKEILEVKPDVTLQDVNGDTALHVIRRKPTLDLRDASARSSLIPQVKDSSTFLGGSLSPRKC